MLTLSRAYPRAAFSPRLRAMNGKYRIVIPLADPALAGDLLVIASGILHRNPGKVIVLGVVEVPEKQNLSEGALQARVQRQLLREVERLGHSEDIQVRTTVRISREAWQGIKEIVAEENASLVILGWSGESKSSERIFGATIQEVAKNPPCDVLLVKGRGLKECRSILLPVRGGPHADLASRLVHSVAEKFDASVTVMHIKLGDPGRPSREDRIFADFVARTQAAGRISHLSVTAPSVEQAVLAEAGNYQLVVLGASAQPEPGSFFGSIPENIAARADATVMVVKTGQPIDVSIFEPQTRSISATVDKWFAENTFHSREFGDVDELVRLKREQGLTISLGLPALNVEKTIKGIVNVIKGELFDRKPLLDEIVLFDGGSTDKTTEIAASFGIPVYDHGDILREYGSYKGKGEALWKALYILKGDIIVWIDTDSMNIHPKFVYGVVGPLLREERLKLVKGFYGRPVPLGDPLYDTASGFLTELTVRPPLNIFFPELSGVVEPLGGQWACCRDALERVPVFSGYGADLGLLIDVFNQFGLAAIGQSDLEERVARDLPLSTMSRRAFALMQACLKRGQARRRVTLLDEILPTMKLIRHRAGRLSLDVTELEEVERPPMATVPEYVKSRRPAENTPGRR
ncbi:MAG: glucosyl-3-phosphoglycerate synthase [Chloroflexi bacterium]|nr:glucosyl-3-phosphoglycerate synthase [Chloroflexota bacterium]